MLQGTSADLVGHWDGAGEVFPNPWGPAGMTRGHWDFRFDGAGLHLIHDYAEQRSDGSRFDGHGVFARDPVVGDILWFWFDSYGFPPLQPARGNWQGSRLELEKQTPRGLGRTHFTLESARLVVEIWSGPREVSDVILISRGVFRRG